MRSAWYVWSYRWNSRWGNLRRWKTSAHICHSCSNHGWHLGRSRGSLLNSSVGGYEDDIDELDYILYTGQGGQDTPGGKQVADQQFTKGNLGFRLICDYGLPVRVTRGHQIKNCPERGYRACIPWAALKDVRLTGYTHCPCTTTVFRGDWHLGHRCWCALAGSKRLSIFWSYP